MNEIISLYIINYAGDLIFWQENVSQHAKKIDQEYLSNILSTLEMIASQIGEEEVKIIELGKISHFISKDNMTGISFVIRCEKGVKAKKINQMLREIKNIFIAEFTGNFNATQIEKVRIMKSFMNSLFEITGEAKKVQYYIDGIKIFRK
ncbi:MAG: hypothetical protein ACTSP6_11460 [Promethearchaeota archaeon]